MKIEYRENPLNNDHDKKNVCTRFEKVHFTDVTGCGKFKPLQED